MNTPEGVLEWIRENAAFDIELAKFGGSPEDVVLPQKVLDWLDTETAIQEPDWSQAPKYANAWIASPFGTEAFFFNADTDVDPRAWEENDWAWILANVEDECESHKYNLGLGKDWRETLRYRPEVSE